DVARAFVDRRVGALLLAVRITGRDDNVWRWQGARRADRGERRSEVALREFDLAIERIEREPEPRKGGVQHSSLLVDREKLLVEKVAWSTGRNSRGHVVASERGTGCQARIHREIGLA